MGRLGGLLWIVVASLACRASADDRSAAGISRYFKHCGVPSSNGGFMLLTPGGRCPLEHAPEDPDARGMLVAAYASLGHARVPCLDDDGDTAIPIPFNASVRMGIGSSDRGAIGTIRCRPGQAGSHAEPTNERRWQLVAAWRRSGVLRAWVVADESGGMFDSMACSVGLVRTKFSVDPLVVVDVDRSENTTRRHTRTIYRWNPGRWQRWMGTAPVSAVFGPVEDGGHYSLGDQSGTQSLLDVGDLVRGTRNAIRQYVASQSGTSYSYEQHDFEWSAWSGRYRETSSSDLPPPR